MSVLYKASEKALSGALFGGIDVLLLMEMAWLLSMREVFNETGMRISPWKCRKLHWNSRSRRCLCFISGKGRHSLMKLDALLHSIKDPSMAPRAILSAAERLRKYHNLAVCALFHFLVQTFLDE